MTDATNTMRLQRIKGVGLLEVLITVVLLSIGFLAAARMQVEGLRFSQSAYYQSQAGNFTPGVHKITNDSTRWRSAGCVDINFYALADGCCQYAWVDTGMTNG